VGVQFEREADLTNTTTRIVARPKIVNTMLDGSGVSLLIANWTPKDSESTTQQGKASMTTVLKLLAKE
jgi:hypothetical protein